MPVVQGNIWGAFPNLKVEVFRIKLKVNLLLLRIRSYDNISQAYLGGSK